MNGSGRRRLLLHACCAPCGTHPFTVLREAFDVTVYFDNPNIFPESEYRARLDEIRALGDRWNFPVETAEYDAGNWRYAIRGLEDEPEGGKRCRVCFRFRLERTAERAAASGMDAFATTLTVSPHKNAALINRIGSEIGPLTGVTFIAADFKKQDGFRKSCALSREAGLYRQDYCGCEFSLREAERRRAR
ncbi:MAG: epoxyqueuosine reductase QueH [bacterium]|nr:epoxyqueuosine reductase QueH [bacterium]